MYNEVLRRNLIFESRLLQKPSGVEDQQSALETNDETTKSAELSSIPELSTDDYGQLILEDSVRKKKKQLKEVDFDESVKKEV